MFLTHQGIAHLCWSLDANTRIEQMSTAVGRQEGQRPVLTDSTDSLLKRSPKKHSFTSPRQRGNVMGKSMHPTCSLLKKTVDMNAV